MKKFLIYLNIITFLNLLYFNIARAICPVCTVVVVGGVGLARWLKVDDVISGIWIGGALLSLTLWTIIWFKNKKWIFPFYQFLIFLLTYGLIIVPLYFSKIIGHPANTFWGIDKFILGIIVGSIVFALAVLFSDWLKKKNHNKVYFPFQKVVVPVGFLLIISVIFYLILKKYGHQVIY